MRDDDDDEEENGRKYVQKYVYVVLKNVWIVIATIFQLNSCSSFLSDSIFIAFSISLFSLCSHIVLNFHAQFAFYYDQYYYCIYVCC